MNSIKKNIFLCSTHRSTICQGQCGAWCQITSGCGLSKHPVQGKPLNTSERPHIVVLIHNSHAYNPSSISRKRIWKPETVIRSVRIEPIVGTWKPIVSYSRCKSAYTSANKWRTAMTRRPRHSRPWPADTTNGPAQSCSTTNRPSDGCSATYRSSYACTTSTCCYWHFRFFRLLFFYSLVWFVAPPTQKKMSNTLDSMFDDPQLTVQQRLFLYLVFHGRFNLLLTGPAGVGKSWILDILAKIAKKMGRRVQFTSTTGVSACLLPNGCTLHSFMGMGLAQGNPRHVARKGAQNKEVKYRIRHPYPGY